eukprot:CAMPEP_0198280698 /NCGR_PEP_ID=MMETSP1449-20131203/727_1 /TAXON_ID=420275 /ORGANISM="Attheya septentrionalis, Strain CCMP2084" /LENGTH=1194 /DNA_ID=CAMNT_0043976127 /DNA_START=257 /DNA_END=3841 /DNA_ORIENTATION=+
MMRIIVFWGITITHAVAEDVTHRQLREIAERCGDIIANDTEMVVPYVCDAQGSFCDYRYGVTGNCLDCQVFTPRDCLDASQFTLSGGEECLKSCFPQECASASCPDEGSFCTSERCMSCNSPLLTHPSNCITFPFSASDHNLCVSTCFQECSSQEPCPNDNTYCNYQSGTHGACVSCEDISKNPTLCMVLSSSVAAQEDCISECFPVVCSSDQPCPTGSFCTFQLGDTGACMDCSFISRKALSPIDCSNLNLPLEGENDCAFSCFDMSGCSIDSPCPIKEEDKFCTFQSSTSSGYCLECNRFGDPLGCFDWGVSPVGEESCAATCFEECSSETDCISGTFCNFQFGNRGYCSDCNFFGDPYDCFNQRESGSLNIWGGSSCASTCFGECWDESDCDNDSFCTFQQGNHGYCMGCNTFKINAPLDCNTHITLAFSLDSMQGQEDCKKSCFDPCSSETPCPDGFFCTYELGDTGYCTDCGWPQIQTPLDCEAGYLDLNSSGQEDCATSCFDVCSAETLCDDANSFCTFHLGGTNGSCMVCDLFALRHPLDCSAKNVKGYGLDLSLPGKKNCAKSCFGSCSASEPCPDESFCTDQFGREGGACMACSALRQDPFECSQISDLLFESGQQNCRSGCFKECSSDDPCSDGFFCDFGFGETGYCMGCEWLGGSPRGCDRSMFNDTVKESCLNTCFEECLTDDECPETEYDNKTRKETVYWCEDFFGAGYCVFATKSRGKDFDKSCLFCPDLKVSYANKSPTTETEPETSWCPNFCPNKDMKLPNRTIRTFRLQCSEIPFLSVDDPSGRDCRLLMNFDYICGCTGHWYGGADTQTKRSVLAWLPRCMAFLSFVGSTLIIVDISRDDRKLKKTFGQLMILLSVFDIMGSVAYAFTTLPIPEEDFIYGAKGTAGTCTAQGFFIQIGMIAAYLNAALSVNYLLMLKYGWSESKMLKIRPWLFGIPVVIGLVFAFAGLPYYDNVILWCNNANANPWPHLPMTFAIVFVTVIMGMMCWHVYKEERVSKKWRSGHGQRTSLSAKVCWQSIYYLLAFYLVWPPYLVLQYTWVAGKGYDKYYFILFSGMLVPLQGFWNAVVYLRPRIKYRDKSDASCLFPFKSWNSRISSLLRSRSQQSSSSKSKKSPSGPTLEGNVSQATPDIFPVEKVSQNGDAQTSNNALSSIEMYTSVFCDVEPTITLEGRVARLS